jgi:hypothetical protein
VISPDLAEFIEAGVSVQVGTRDARLVPECQRAVGARVEPDREEVTVFVPCGVGERIAADARATGRIAVCFSRISDHHSIQLKGAVSEVRLAEVRERKCIERYLQALAEVLGTLGLPHAITLRLAHWPCFAIRFRVETSFVQTPGPGAGRPVGGAQR